MWEGAGDWTELQYFDPHSYGRQRCVFLVLQGCSTGGPGAQLSAGWWLSLLHLITNRSGPQTPSGYPRAPSVGCGFPYHILSSNSSDLQLELQLWLLSWLSYIIVQRPLSRLLKLWNRMFDRHQAEITVIQFTGHSLPVHQSMSVPWEFFTSSHFISQFPPTRFPLITAIRMCHFLPVHHLGMAFLARSKAKIQHVSDKNIGCNITVIYLYKELFLDPIVVYKELYLLIWNHVTVWKQMINIK